MTVFLNEEHKKNKAAANKIASYLKYTTLQDIRNKVEIYYDPLPYDKGGFMEQDNVFNVFYSHNATKYSCQSDINKLPWLTRIELDKEKMMDKNITLLDIKSKFCNNWDKRYKEAKGIKKEERQLLEIISQAAILSNNDNDELPIIHIRFDMTEFNFSILISFLETFIENFELKGLSSIKKIDDVSDKRYINFSNENQDMNVETQYLIYTAGINLVDIRYLNGIDLNKTTCNDVTLIYEKFGIEAARMALLKEIKAVFEGAGNKINFQNHSILIDIMTNNGTLTSTDRHGLNRLETDPLARASFEKTVDQLLNAAVFGEVDHMKSVSSRIMSGLVIKGGTGLFNVLLNTDLLEKSEYVEDIESKYKKTFNELSSNAIMKDIIKKESANIFIPLE